MIEARVLSLPWLDLIGDGFEVTALRITAACEISRTLEAAEDWAAGTLGVVGVFTTRVVTGALLAGSFGDVGTATLGTRTTGVFGVTGTLTTGILGTDGVLTTGTLGAEGTFTDGTRGAEGTLGKETTWGAALTAGGVLIAGRTAAGRADVEAKTRVRMLPAIRCGVFMDEGA